VAGEDIATEAFGSAPTIQRRGDWHSRLNAFVDGVKRMPFDWATNNCGEHFAFGAVKTMTDVDIGSHYRGRYTTAAGAVRVMRKDGFDNLGDLVASHLPEIHPSRARLGDLAAIPDDSPFGFTLGVVNGETVLMLGEHSMAVVPISQAARTFAVG
jgi:hypothetical protein